MHGAMIAQMENVELIHQLREGLCGFLAREHLVPELETQPVSLASLAEAIAERHSSVRSTGLSHQLTIFTAVVRAPRPPPESSRAREPVYLGTVLTFCAS